MIKVVYKGQTVGTMAMPDRRYVAFEYDKDWLDKGFSISPL